ncbi:hypothetical protein GJ654_10295 [Rhodoblastus acidophilus]|uniref:ParB/Spo0J HTH domain-containing protein n=1 Tax=Rhodoblastus acidophilus TaxID=1074 RepID=A0A6N8DQB4_RHOAC|nr:hypothetical protein [Rhodoblastus acidophilus]MCW2275114.1 ParB-like chromosome segregation protein Spo0J [Rhodoblastus acidophilus]MTV31383.1 hypothetical protein [Rhodoblastus acidophilus]
MANLKELAESRSALLNFDPRKIAHKDGLNARDLTTVEARDHIDFLKASIRENGFYQNSPLEIFSEGEIVYVSDGHCRHTAVMELIAEGVEIATVPCVPEGKGVNDVDRILRQNISNSGKRLTPLEEGYNIKRALGFGLTLAEIARRIGKSPSYVSKLVEFQAAPAEVHQMVKEGKVSATLAAETMRENPEHGADALKEAVAKASDEGKAKVTKKDVEPRRKPINRDELISVLNVCANALRHSHASIAERVDALLETME